MIIMDLYSPPRPPLLAKVIYQAFTLKGVPVREQRTGPCLCMNCIAANTRLKVVPGGVFDADFLRSLR